MPRADLLSDEIVVRANWVEKDRVAQIPGMNYRRDQTWHGPASWGTYVTLRGVFGDALEVGPELLEWLVTYSKAHIESAWAIREAHEFSVDDLDQAEYLRLYPYQRVGARFTHLNDGVLIADEMGCGKTPQTLVALATIPDGLPALIVCPNSVKGHWAKEAGTWFPDAVPYVIGGSAKDRRELLAKAAHDPFALVIMNFEAMHLHSRLAPYGSVRLLRCRGCGGSDPDFKQQKCEAHPKELNVMPFNSVIVDEAHRMKDPKTKQTRAIWAVQHGRQVRHRWALTGTPIASHVGDLWSIMHGVAPGDYPTKSKFIDRYALLAWNPHAVMDIVGVRPDTFEEFNAILKPRMRRMLKSIVARQLPPKVYELREAPMAPKQAKAYRQMKEHMIAELDEGEQLVASRNLTKMIRLLQFSSAYAEIERPDPDDPKTWKVRISEPSPKLDVMMEVLAEVGDRQVAICAASRQLIEMAAKRLDAKGITYRLLTGVIPQAERQLNIDQFQRGEVQCMLFTIAAGGVGVNMSAADTIVFLQRSWSMLENRQAEDRVHRMGSERHESITIVDIVAPDTVEVKQLHRLYEKARRLEEVVRDREKLQAAGLPIHDLEQRELELSRDDMLV